MDSAGSSSVMVAELRTPGIPDTFMGSSGAVNPAALGGALGAAAVLGAGGALGALAAGGAGAALGGLAMGATGVLGSAALGAGAMMGSAALGAGAMMGSAVLGTGAMVGSALASRAMANPLSLLPGKIGQWAGSGRYDYPAGGEIDLYNNRLCFDEPCRFDPENSGDYSMEWLRRAAPMVDYPYPPIFHKLQVELEKPDRLMNLIPYGDVSSANENCFHHKVYMGTEAPVLKQAGIMGSLPSIIKDFI
jgi:hypothetical protein